MTYGRQMSTQFCVDMRCCYSDRCNVLPSRSDKCIVLPKTDGHLGNSSVFYTDMAISIGMYFSSVHEFPKSSYLSGLRNVQVKT